MTATEFAREYYNLPASQIETVYMESAIKFAEKYVQQQLESRWVDCNDKLPEYGEKVLTLRNENILIGKLNINGWSVYYSDGESMTGELTPTHWQPLPQIPTT